jgi:hypothetical protein
MSLFAVAETQVFVAQRNSVVGSFLFHFSIDNQLRPEQEDIGEGKNPCIRPYLEPAADEHKRIAPLMGRFRGKGVHIV